MDLFVIFTLSTTMDKIILFWCTLQNTTEL